MDKDGHTHHISQQFNDELERVRSHLLEMGGLVESQVTDAVHALLEADSARAEAVRTNDKRINSMELSIDEECIRILARRQPAASDLRLVIAVTKGITDLERVGDEARKIAEQAIQLCESGQSPKGYVEARHIGGLVVRMLHEALDAFARQDVDMALSVVEQDKRVDMEYASAMRELVTVMMEDPRTISRVLSIMWSLRSLERVGDHARNLAEYVIYLVKGEDVRHIGLQELASKIKS
ncbi:MAG: phosphate signaling complex protein PhoU [Gammaproteobacteria bacterium]|nr:MAG: phosphate signaling complex protein PhoU [Gammaproteobacteria bacterium]